MVNARAISRVKLACALAILVVLAMPGCMDNRGDSPQNPVSTDMQSISATQTNGAQPLPVTSSYPTSLSWNECHGAGASIPYGETVLMMDRGERPPGWEPQAADNGMYTFMLSSCERISVGGFERGPASFLLEMHWAVDPPEACREFEPGFRQAAVVVSVWVDDAEVAALLRDQLQMPVVLGTITGEVVQQGDAQIQTWTWQAEGNEASTITVGHPGGDETPGAPVERLIWHNGTGVSFFDAAYDRLLPDVPVPQGQGVLAPPMRIAAAGPTPFVGLNSVWKTADFYGPIYRFGDLECKNLLS